MATSIHDACRFSFRQTLRARRDYMGTFRILLSSILVIAAFCDAVDAHISWSGAGVGARAAGDLVDRSGVAREDQQANSVVPDILSRQDMLGSDEGDGDDDDDDPDTSTITTRNAPTTTDIPIGMRTSTPASPSASQTGATIDDSDASQPTTTSWPTVFDANMGNNFTQQACPAFINSFRDDNNFNSCLPLSLLIQNSRSFFEQMRTPARLREVLDHTCQAVFENCRDIMASYAMQIRSDDNCGQDYRLGNPLVVSAYLGFISYEPLYRAGCLRESAAPIASLSGSSGVAPDNSTTNSTSPSSVSSRDDGPTDGRPEWCFVSSTLSDTPADNFIYSLPLGLPLPGASRPTCSRCLSETMEYFAVAAANMSSPLSRNYPPAAMQINSGCGPDFVAANVQPIEGTGDESGAIGLRHGLESALIAAAIGILVL